MRKIFAFVILCLGVLASTSLRTAEAAPAQVIVVSNICCDAYGNQRCRLNGYFPVGSGCFCYGQGSGWVC